MNPLSDNNIFKIPLDSRYSRPDLCLIYAPLSGNMLIASESDCIKLSAIIENKTPGDESSREVLEALLSGIPASQREGKVNHVNDFLY